MASNREERLQMRQRGAGTRRIKEVNFGFALGLEPAPEEPPQPASPQPAEQPTAVEPDTQPPSLLAPPPPSPPPQSSQSSSGTKPSSQELPVQRTPGSARNKLPPRPSTFDIPGDDELELGRSNKRRKIEPPGVVSRPSVGTRASSKSPKSALNGTTTGSKIPHRDEQVSLPIRAGGIPEKTLPPNEGLSTESPPASPIAPNENVDNAHEQLGPDDTEQTAPQLGTEPPKPNGTASPSDSSTGRRKRRGQGESQPSPTQDIPRPEIINQGDSPVVEAPHLSPPEPLNGSFVPEVAKTRRGKRLRSQTPVAEKSPPGLPITETAPETSENAVNLEVTHPEDNVGKGRRGRKRKNRVPTPKASGSNEVPNEAPSEQIGGEPEQRDSAMHEDGGPHVEDSIQVDKGKKRAGRPKRKATESPEIMEESHNTGKRKRPRRGERREQTPEPDTEPEPQPEHQREAPAEIQTERDKDQEPTAGIKRRRGRRPTAQTEQNVETPKDISEEPPQRTQKKPRQPRGETVPVTVHRLANVATLGDPAQDDLPEEGDSADELSSQQKTKLPSRGGVNAADVLGQICRETLEKTLTTLKNGIANEGNAAKRAEWTVRRKAVEAFGVELEGRLLDLSEMLDSNFMLGVQAKKAKRKMMDLRTRLDQVRRERQAVALRMDAVRSEHTKEEHARMARSTINHSLHNLDLALERGRNGLDRTGDAPVTAGLEFNLRSVADSVSSIASGAQGGLLNQIRRFNAQLEATARRLES